MGEFGAHGVEGVLVWDGGDGGCCCGVEVVEGVERGGDVLVAFPWWLEELVELACYVGERERVGCGVWMGDGGDCLDDGGVGAVDAVLLASEAVGFGLVALLKLGGRSLLLAWIDGLYLDPSEFTLLTSPARLAMGPTGVVYCLRLIARVPIVQLHPEEALLACQDPGGEVCRHADIHLDMTTEVDDCLDLLEV